ncbi:MAG: DUF3078 domain-containing protein [Phycisphaerae bacterium]|nr:DUF3078 domain-containing protein [Phycisphaerae bacterium]
MSAQESQQAAPEYGWKRQIIGNINLTQASFDNWEQGGESALAWQVNLNTTFTLDREKYSWSNSGKFTLGFAKVGDTEAKKSDDVINIESVFTRKLTKLLNPFVAVTAKTQFVSGFEFDGDEKTKVSEFMDPGYFTQSVGVGYAPNDVIKTRVGFSVKETITSDFPIPYADDPDTPEIEKTKIEPGISSVTDVKKNFQEDVLFTSKLDIFSDLEAFDRIDVLWENSLTLKVTKFINVSVNVDLLYDKDISDKYQLKQVLAVGLTYAFL